MKNGIEHYLSTWNSLKLNSLLLINQVWLFFSFNYFKILSTSYSLSSIQIPIMWEKIIKLKLRKKVKWSLARFIGQQEYQQIWHIPNCSHFYASESTQNQSIMLWSPLNRIPRTLSEICWPSQFADNKLMTLNNKLNFKLSLILVQLKHFNLQGTKVSS